MRSGHLRVLVIDDEEYVCLMVEHTLREEGCEVTIATGGQAGIDLLQTGAFDCVITDLRMPGVDGRAVMKWLEERQPDVDVLMLTGHGDVKDAVEAMKHGAWDFLVKDTPFDPAIVKAAITKLRAVRSLKQEVVAARRGGFVRDVIVEGVSSTWMGLATQIRKVASSDAPVLIYGETGSGKEIVARLLHKLSTRSDAPFLAVNCGGLSRELLENELFGHEKGAFTGAMTAQTGLVAAAHTGTLFLDELSEMPSPMQVNLLRFLDRHEYRPVGGTRTLQADVRIIGATNLDLQVLVDQGRFREDLFYRVNAVTLRVPPLRERTEDLPLLIDHILRTLRIPGAPHRTVTANALTRLKDYPWPGNVRELRNVIERAVLMNPEPAPITDEEIQGVLPEARRSVQPQDLSRLSLAEMEQLHIRRVLDANGGNKTQAAKALDIDYKTLLSKLKQHSATSE